MSETGVSDGDSYVTVAVTCGGMIHVTVGNASELFVNEMTADQAVEIHQALGRAIDKARRVVPGVVGRA